MFHMREQVMLLPKLINEFKKFNKKISDLDNGVCVHVYVNSN